MNTDVAWHEVECGGYAADFELWAELAETADGAILDLGCGAGRVALHLAGLGFEVSGLDCNPHLVAAFNRRAGSLPARAEVGDARSFELGERFGLIIAPMQLLQLFTGPDERTQCMRRAAQHLLGGAKFGVAIVESIPMPTTDEPPLPDAQETEGWIYSSLPLETVVDGEEIAVRRLRQTVSPEGALSEHTNEVRLRSCSARRIEREGKSAGLVPVARHEIPASEDHIGSTVVVLEGMG